MNVNACNNNEQGALLPKHQNPLYRSLGFQVIVSIIVGIGFGYFFPSAGASMRPLGDAFIKLIKMIIGPIIFCTIVSGIAGMDDMKKVGRVGGKALIYFEVLTTIALIIGLIVINLTKPGAGMNIDVSALDTQAISAYTTAAKSQNTVDFFMNIIPSTVFDAFAKGEILQILLFSIMFGTILARMGSKGKLMFGFINEFTISMFKMVDMIMALAPIGVFGSMAFTIGRYGLASLGPLGKLLIIFYLTCIAFVLVIMGLVAKWAGFSILKFIAYVKDELLIVLGTSSSESVLPRMMDKMERLGCSKPVVGLVIPTGYSFNLDGTSIYLTMSAIFLAQATNVELSLMQELTIVAVLLLTSKGASGVTGSGFIVLAATLSIIPSIPVAALAVIFGIDRFMSTGRALTNMVGNGVATIVVSEWEHELDPIKLQAELARGSHPLETAHENA
jgi:aerobic C4-dicarboxylate transport protein